MGKRDRVLAWLRLARLIPLAGPTAYLPMGVLALAYGVLPSVFTVAMGLVVRTLTAGPVARISPAEILSRAGTDLKIGFAALVLQQALTPLQEAVAVLAARRIDRHTLADVLRTALRSPLEHVEDERAVDAVAEVSDAFVRNAPTPGVAAAALPQLAGRYLQLVSAVVLVAVTISVGVAVLLLIGAVILRYGQRGSLDKFAAERAKLAGARRRMNYIEMLGIEPRAAKEIRVLNLLPWLRQRYDREVEGYLVPLWRRRRAVLFRPFLVYTGIGFLIAVTAFVLLGQGFEPAQGVVFLAVAIQAILVPLRFGTYFPECDMQTQYGMQCQSTIAEFRASVGRPVARPEPGARPTAAAVEPGALHAIRFREVRFGYGRRGAEVLRGLDFELPAGRSTALVGVNGAGKTTVVKLLSGLYAPTGGRITVDGRDLAGLDPAGWRREVAVIFQNSVRFDLTLRENLLLGAAHRPVDLDAMHAALARASATDIADRLPHGLDTVLSPEYTRGTGLSGGQWQRIALARAFYAVGQGATVLVLDEPTAQLDVRAEVDFYERFLELTEGLTTLVISHRFSTVRRADRIAVLSEGRIGESGSHDELLDADGTYASMFRVQRERFTAALGRGDDR
ncbi:ABC transporter ATP-binding protein [Actinospica sp. MGRD01-02]|uniref:ABC transporter ATP-binding protein n=1 Tax=Actinospica acidithermotolerans TaxID=2828514 RepID=A0A941E8R5_9ACTN|nr:ABC transporter ATP-binding protein [Actinospica acidithermotolerans]MBR7825993.1 ABC transporter ATP-binding protein [Actinospica acidithermotolerans]